MSMEERLQELGIVLPKANPPAAVYCPGIQVGKLVFIPENWDRTSL